MELGGKNPMIVLADYDVDQAVHLAGYGAFFHQGAGVHGDLPDHRGGAAVRRLL